MKTVIMAGGKGTRIASKFKDIPKPMIPIAGKPVLEHQIECLREQGLNEIIITVGYLGNQIMNYFGDGSNISPVTQKKFGVNITYYVEKSPLGNAGALFFLRNQLKEDFLLINADSIFNIDLKRFIHYHFGKKGIATLFTHPNSHPYDSALIITDERGAVEQWINKEEKHPIYYKNKVNAGLHILSPSILRGAIKSEIVDLDRDILKPLAKTGKMYAYQSPEYVKDMGTPERYEIVCKDYENNLYYSKNLRNTQKAIFLDRDGVLNKYVGFLTKVEQLELLEGVSEAIEIINKSEYLAIVVTNQPVIARGETSLTELNNIHNKIETLLGEKGAYLDAIYFCPHHPDKGFAGEKVEYKIACQCRKPKPGMIIKAANEFNIDLSMSWMIGDSENDIIAGKNAHCKTIYIGTENRYCCDVNCKNLLDAVKRIIHS